MVKIDSFLGLMVGVLPPSNISGVLFFQVVECNPPCGLFHEGLPLVQPFKGLEMVCLALGLVRSTSNS